MTTIQRDLTPIELARFTRDGERWADNPEFLALLEADLVQQLSRPAPPDCPAWCDEPNHDGYGELSGEKAGWQMLSHTLTVTEGVIVVLDEFREPDDTVTRSVPFIHTYSDGEHMSADQAEAHGRALVTAAAKLREIGRVA